MHFNITSKKEEPLLARTLIKATVEFEKATPSYQEVTSLISTHTKTDEKLVVIRHVYNQFGGKKADVIAYLYKDEAKKLFIEPKVKEKKSKEAKKA